jgi:selenium-binding protein 1
MAMKAPAETLAYVAAFDPTRKVPDGIAVVDVDPGSANYSKILNTVAMPNAGDELHHFGWNACSSCLCPNAPHPHIERRYLVVPGLRSSRIHILDTKPDPRHPAIVKVIEPRDVAERAGYTRPHTVHCGPEGIYVAALGNREGKGPGGVFLMDHETFDVLGQWEMDRGPQQLAYDAWWHLGHDTLVTSEWGTPDTFENGLIPEVLLGAKYGRRLHFWDLHSRKHLQTIDFGDKYQLVFELRPAHDGIRLRQLRDEPREPLVLDLDLVSRGRQMGGQESDRDTGRAGGSGATAADAQRLQGVSAAGDRHRPFHG